MQLTNEAILNLTKAVTKELNMSITFPSDAQPSVAPARDFYVIGSFDGIAVPDDASCHVFLSRLDDNGNPIATVREVYTETKDDKDNLYIDYPRLSYYGSDRTELRNSCICRLCQH